MKARKGARTATSILYFCAMYSSTPEMHFSAFVRITSGSYGASKRFEMPEKPSVVNNPRPPAEGAATNCASSPARSSPGHAKRRIDATRSSFRAGATSPQRHFASAPRGF